MTLLVSAVETASLTAAESAADTAIELARVFEYLTLPGEQNVL
jgi:hypothetical protein